jgi:hypothetical protein
MLLPLRVLNQKMFMSIKAQHDNDYTCWIVYKDLTIALLFHGKLAVNFEHEETFSEFYKKANSLILNN